MLSRSKNIIEFPEIFELGVENIIITNTISNEVECQFRIMENELNKNKDRWSPSIYNLALGKIKSTRKIIKDIKVYDDGLNHKDVWNKFVLSRIKEDSWKTRKKGFSKDFFIAKEINDLSANFKDFEIIFATNNIGDFKGFVSPRIFVLELDQVLSEYYKNATLISKIKAAFWNEFTEEEELDPNGYVHVTESSVVESVGYQMGARSIKFINNDRFVIEYEGNEINGSSVMELSEKSVFEVKCYMDMEIELENSSVEVHTKEVCIFVNYSELHLKEISESSK